MTRRGNGDGSIRQRTPDRWEARYIGADGRRHSVYAKTRREAQERLRTALMAAEHGIRPLNQRLTVSAFLASWLADTVAPQRRPRTVESYRDTVRRYIDPSIGN